MSSRRPTRRAATLLAALMAAATIGAVPPTAGAARSPGPTLVLDAQTQWVEPSGTSPTSPFNLTLSVSGAPTTAELSVRLFGKLTARSALEADETRATGPIGRPRTATLHTLALSTLPADPHVAGAVDLKLGMATSAMAAESAPGYTLDLGCPRYTCPGGVYPVEIVLSDAAGTELAHLTTFCTYVNGQSTLPLDFALVLPVSAPVDESVAGNPLDAIGKLPTSEVSSLGTLVGQVHTNPGVELTLEPSPETLQRLWSSGAAGQATVKTLESLSENQSEVEIPAEPYVPIDLSSLAGAGEPTELEAQMTEGQVVFKELGIEATTARTGVWVAADAGPGLTTGLSEIGATKLVVPDSDLAPTTQTVEAADTYRLGSAGTTAGRLVAPADATVSAELSDSGLMSTDPSLAASDLLADLAFVYFEAPYTPQTRGIVGAAPTGWRPNTTFDQVLLSGLQGNPVVKTTTLPEFFHTVPAATTARPLTTTRSGATVAPVLGHTSAKDLSQARLQLTAFVGAVTPAKPPAVLSQLGQLLLCAETTADRGSGKGRTVISRLGVFKRALDSQLDQVSIVGAHDGEQTVTLTAQSGFIPVTVVSQLHYPIRGVLTVKGTKFQFITDDGRTKSSTDSKVMKLTHPTNTWRFDVVARSSGELPLRVTFSVSAGGGTLVFASGSIGIRSTATSVAGIVLTVLALAVLLAWWARTWRSGRRRRRAAHPAAATGT